MSAPTIYTNPRHAFEAMKRLRVGKSAVHLPKNRQVIRTALDTWELAEGGVFKAKGTCFDIMDWLSSNR